MRIGSPGRWGVRSQPISKYAGAAPGASTLILPASTP
jgi:hypothetical protein